MIAYELWQNTFIDNEMALHFQRHNIQMNVDLNNFKASVIFLHSVSRWRIVYEASMIV